jgi:hypothetical protein
METRANYIVTGAFTLAQTVADRPEAATAIRTDLGAIFVSYMPLSDSASLVVKHIDRPISRRCPLHSLESICSSSSANARQGHSARGGLFGSPGRRLRTGPGPSTGGNARLTRRRHRGRGLPTHWTGRSPDSPGRLYKNGALSKKMRIVVPPVWGGRYVPT